MCGPPLHEIYFYKEEKFCCISTLCDSWSCSEQPELCSHQGVGSCICEYEDEDDDEGAS